MAVRRGRTYMISGYVRLASGASSLRLQASGEGGANVVTKAVTAPTGAWARVWLLYTARRTETIGVSVTNPAATASDFFLDDMSLDNDSVPLTDVSGLLDRAAGPGWRLEAAPKQAGGSSNIQWDANGTTFATPPATMMWRDAWA
jgi:hypothetical protein